VTSSRFLSWDTNMANSKVARKPSHVSENTLFPDNIRAQEIEPPECLEGKLAVSGSKKRVIEITKIITWIEAFIIFSMIICHTSLSRWKDLKQYKLLEPRPLQFSHQISGYHFSCFRLLHFPCLVTNRASGVFGQSPV